MAVLYALSDIHGQLAAFKAALRQVNLNKPGNRLFLLGDYIDYGPESGPTLRYIYKLQQIFGSRRVVALKGNHEVRLLEWLAAYNWRAKEDELPVWSDWLAADKETGFITLRSLLSAGAWAEFAVAMHNNEEKVNRIAARLLLRENQRLLEWLRRLPLYYETERQIFVHAGILEEAGDLWAFGTPEHVFTEKFPAAFGPFYKDIIAGHIATADLAGEPDYHRIFWDGQSHYYIDGGGNLPVLQYDMVSERYTELSGGAERSIRKFSIFMQ